jgi:hypothetical protein
MGGRNSGDDTGYKILLILIAIGFIITVIYLLAQWAIWIGLIAMLIGGVMFVLTLNSDNDEAKALFGLVFVGGLILLGIGAITQHFFDSDPTGQLLMNYSHTVINSSEVFTRGMLGK